VTAAEEKLSAKASAVFEYFALVALRAHATWLPAVPMPLYARALRSRDGCKLLSRWLAFQLELSMPAALTLTDNEQWLLKPADFYKVAATELGAALSSAWMRTNVSRHAQQALGEPLYTNAMAKTFAGTDEAVAAILSRAGSVESLRSTIEAIGVHAMIGTLPIDERKLPLRARIAFAKRWLEYDALASIPVDPALIQPWIDSKCREDRSDADANATKVAKEFA
jgi:hypothetical protein